MRFHEIGLSWQISLFLKPNVRRMHYCCDMRISRSWIWLLLGAVLLGAGAMAFVAVRPASPGAPLQVGRIAHPSIAEASGIVASRKHPGVFWTHNDRGNAPILYAISAEGESIAEFRIGAKNEDWEDIAADDQGRIYIGQIGNNDANKTLAKVFIIDEPDPATSGAGRGRARVAVQRTVELKYPEKPFDAESLFVHQGYGYLISKLTKKQAAGLYRFPLEESTEPIVLEKLGELPIRSPVTGADLSPDGQRLAVLSMEGLDIFQVNNNPASAGSAQRHHFPLPRGHDFEACCFTSKGVLIAAETREIFLFPAAPMGRP
jgi:hypothetical protein